MAAVMTPTNVNTESSQKNSQLEVTTSLAYAFCLIASAGVVHLVSDYEFSCVLTLSVFFQALAFGFVLMQIESTADVSGISGKSMTLFAATLVLRLTSTLFFDGYLPLDATGDFTHQFADILSLAMLLKIMHSCYYTHRHSIEADKDTANVKDIVMVCVASALLVHPDLNDWVMFDVAWAASLYVETAAMLPQLMMISKTGKIPSYTSHYIFATLMSRGFSAWFWVYGAANLADLGSAVAAQAVVMAHLVQFVLLAGFGYYYLKHAAKNAIEH